MTSRLGLRLFALALPAALLVPSTAQAVEVTVADGAGDARAINMAVALGELLSGTSAVGPNFFDAPSETSVDVVSTTIDHATKRLTLTVQLRDLVEAEGLSAEVRIYTPDGRWDLSTAYVDGETRWTLFPSVGRGAVISSDGATISATPDPKGCRTVRARYDVTGDRLTASMPTVCLGKPKWVQVAAAVVRTKLTPLGDGSANVAAYVDDPFRSRVSFGSLGRSPKVRRG